MDRNALFYADGDRIVSRVGDDMSPTEARARILREAEHGTANPAMHNVCLLLIGDLMGAIRSAEAFTPANDGEGDDTPPPACSAAIPNTMTAEEAYARAA